MTPARRLLLLRGLGLTLAPVATTLAREPANRQPSTAHTLSEIEAGSNAEPSVSTEKRTVRLAAAWSNADETAFGITVHDAHGRERLDQSLPARLHDAVFHPSDATLVVFDRRPGTHMHVIDLAGRRAPLAIRSQPGRHYYGHGCFDAAGSLLFVTENDYAHARGMIGIYDVAHGYRRTGEFATAGVGPHDIALLQDGHTLVVANGGIETHPDTGREKLNLHTMQSALAVIDARDGTLIRQHALPAEFRQLSLRHLAIDSLGNCCFGAQYEGAPEDLPPLVGALSASGRLALWQPAARYTAALKSYVSSITPIPGTPLVATSSSHGGVTLIWDSRSGQVERMLDTRDGSGVASTADRLYVSSGDGSIRQVAMTGSEHETPRAFADHPGRHWDNHMVIAG